MLLSLLLGIIFVNFLFLLQHSFYLKTYLLFLLKAPYNGEPLIESFTKNLLAFCNFWLRKESFWYLAQLL